MYFSDEDRKLIESLKYDKSLNPRFDQLKSCFFWNDEWPRGISDEGYQELTTLWVSRFFIYHSELPEEKRWIFSIDTYKNAWKLAVESGLKWPGFEKDRLCLSDADKTLLADELRRLSELDEL